MKNIICMTPRQVYIVQHTHTQTYVCVCIHIYAYAEV